MKFILLCGLIFHPKVNSLYILSNSFKSISPNYSNTIIKYNSKKLLYNKRIMSALATTINTNTAITHVNPLLEDWSSIEYGFPPFQKVHHSDFEQGLTIAMEKHLEELHSIVNQSEEPTFDNTILAFDTSGKLFHSINNMFDNLCSSNSPPELQAIELKMAIPLASHYNKITSLPGLFSRIKSIYEIRLARDYNSEQIRLIERFYLDFVRSGALFSKEDQVHYAKITEDLASLCTIFTQNLLADESDIYLELQISDLAGLPNDLIASAKQAAIERNKDKNIYVITLSRSLVEPFITYSERQDLREKAWKLWTRRGELDNSRNNLHIANQILQLRVQQAKMHGYNNYAEYATADTMAGKPEKVLELIEQVWGPAKQSVARERQELEEYIKNTLNSNAQGEIVIHPWDWRYYAEKVRQKNYNLDENQIKPYFSLDNMCEAIFDCAYQLFGLTFKLRDDIQAYHPDVKVYEVHEKLFPENEESSETKVIAIFLHDNYARPNKKGGAWMSEYRTQSRNKDTNDRVIPIVVNNNNFNKPAPGEVCLLSYDDANTLFHEFGHGLHGMLSDVTYQRLAGTSVLRDFVELPSQLYEHWLGEPSVLKKHAKHYLTSEVIPDELLVKLKNAQKFGEGFNTIEYSACVLIDIALHKLTDQVTNQQLDITAFEDQELGRLGMPAGIVMRHRPAHFAHLFAGSGYASAYYVYLWAAVLDADGYDAFHQSGNCFDKDTAIRVKKFIYSAGNSLDPSEAYRLFRGRDPIIEPMLKKKGLLG